MKAAYEAAKADLGTWEWAEGHNPKVVQYFADVGHSWVKDDETAWCAAFVGAMLKKAGLPHTGKLNARSYLDWGQPVDLDDAQPGDVVVLWRGSPNAWTGHVAFLDRIEGGFWFLLGGNQSDQVNVAGYPRDRVLGVRRMSGKTSKAQSTTVQASVGGAVATVTGAGAAVGQLDGTAQIVLIVAAVAVLVALAWIARERIKRWAAGDR